jgi:WD40 repeat protein
MAFDHARVKTLFLEAADLRSPEERAAYLDRECVGEPELRARVEALLAIEARADRVSRPDASGVNEPSSTAPLQPATAVADAGGSTEPDDTGRSEPWSSATPDTAGTNEQHAPTRAGLSTGEQIPGATRTSVEEGSPADRPGGTLASRVIAGRYTLVDILGEGGMGTVYRANQTQPVKRQVALKLIRIGMDSRAVLARFDAERQALALMDHPSIARVYDGGTTAAGQPFFVMELVDGVPITDYCDRHRLPVQPRLELFVAVCQAVQHAHQKGIIHRDLKPGNVLITEVDGRPTPKVIDFGVARATEQKLTDLSLVETGAIVGTPAYMSPEQANPSSRDIDTRTDVYALGVILYELLAGSPPIDAKQFRRDAFLEMLRIVREIDPPRPSTKVSTSDSLPSIAASRGIEPSQLKRLLRGDLDWIVMKALEKDRARRYETANGFAADVLRHLAHEPVLAAPPSRAYRVHKFVRKHRGAVVAACLVVLALMAGIAGTTLGLFRAENRRVEAEQARAREAQRVEERDVALGHAKDATRVADDRADKLKYQLGISDFLLASAAYESRDVVLAAERLDNVPAKQRGWEWHYLKRLTRGGLFTLYGHTRSVNSASFSPDGTRIITASSDRTAKVWDTRTGSPLLELKGHTEWVESASFSPDGSRVVTASGDRTAKVWDARTGSPLLELKGHTDTVMSAVFSPDGTRIVTASSDRTAKVCDARTGSELLELKGDTAQLESAAFSPDGTRIVTASLDGTRVWDARTGTPLLELRGQTAAASSASFSPDGTRIITASGDQTAMVWDARTGTPLLELKGHTSPLTRAAFSPDGTRIVTASWDQTAKVWDARTGTLLLELKGHTNTVNSATFSPDGARIVSASRDLTAKVWDARAGTSLLELKGHRDTVYSAAFSPDGSRIVTTSFHEPAKVWDARTGAPLLELKGHTAWVHSAAFSPDGTRIVTASGDRTAKVWDARTGSLRRELRGHTAWVQSAAFSPDGSRIVTASGDLTAKVWDAHAGTSLLELKGHTSGVASAAFSPDGAHIVTGSWDGLKVWDARTGSPLLGFKGDTRAVTSATFSPDGAHIVTGSWDGLKVRDARTGSPLFGLKGHAGAVTSATFSPDGARIVSASRDMTAKVWDARTGTPLLELRGHRAAVSSAAFSSDGTRIITASGDLTSRVWEARKGAPVLELKQHSDWVHDAVFSPDVSRIVTASSDGTAKVWEVRTGVVLLELKGHTGAVTSAAFSSDGARIVTASSDRTARVWDARTGTLLLELKGHTNTVNSATFSPDGARIVTASSDQKAKVWDARTGALLLDVKGHTGAVTSAAFSPDGSRIVTASSDRTAKVWDTQTGQEVVGAPIPPALRPGRNRPGRVMPAMSASVTRTGQISPDGRWIAHIFGNRVELILLPPDEEELSYRRLVMQPNFGLYREAYDAAMKSNDAFAARFYFNLFPPPQRVLIRAESIVKPLFDHLLVREDVLDALQAQPDADPEIQAACLKLTGTWSESADECNNAGWPLVRDPGLAAASYQRGLRLAEVACRLEPENAMYVNTLGVAQYRCGLMTEALKTLTRSNAFNNGEVPSDLAFLALAQHRLGQSEKALATLSRLRQAMKAPNRAVFNETFAILHEAETIELDKVFPSDPFAH